MTQEEAKEIFDRSAEAIKILQTCNANEARVAALAVEGLRDLADEYYVKFYELRKLHMDYELRRLRQFVIDIKNVMDKTENPALEKAMHAFIVDMSCHEEARSVRN